MRLERVRPEFVGEAADIWNGHFLRAREALPALPDISPRDDAAAALAYLFGRGDGFAAFEGERMTGYLCFYGAREEMFGRVRGAFSPLAGNAFPDEKTCLALYARAAEYLVDKGVFQHAIAVFANEEAIIKTLALEGMGLRCADAMRALDGEWVAPGRFAVRECAEEDMARLLPLSNALSRHLAASPVFMPCEDMDETAYRAWRKARDSRFFAAEIDGEFAGYTEVMDSGENVVSENKAVKNICGMYVAPRYRGMGVAEALSAHAANAVYADGIRSLGVDFETINPHALHFWCKHFTIYTYSLVRRIDERAGTSEREG